MHPFYKIWSDYLARQFRKPSGLLGGWVSNKMEERNKEPYRWLMDEISIAPSHRVLEIGYGPGFGISKFAEIVASGGGAVFGIDFSKSIYRKALKRHRALILQKKVYLECGDAAQMPFEERSFDRVFAVNVTYFWPRPIEQLREIFRVLYPGGMVCIYFTDNESLKVLPMTRTGVFHFHDQSDLARDFEEVGFSQIEFRDRQIDEGRPRFGHLVLAKRPL